MRQTDLLEKTRVQTLNHATQDAVKDILQGGSPVDVMAKVANANNLSGPELDRVVEATNVNLTNHHVKTKEGSDRSCEHITLDTDEIRSAVFPTQDALMKAASSMRVEQVDNSAFDLDDVYSGMDKAASAEPTEAVYDPVGADAAHHIIKAATRYVTQTVSRINGQAEDLIKDFEQERTKLAASLRQPGSITPEDFVKFALDVVPSLADDAETLLRGIPTDDSLGQTTDKYASKDNKAVEDDNIRHLMSTAKAYARAKFAQGLRTEITPAFDRVQDVTKSALNIGNALIGALDRRLMPVQRMDGRMADLATKKYNVYNPYDDPEFRDVVNLQDHLDQIVSLEKLRNQDPILRKSNPQELYQTYTDTFGSLPESSRNPGLVKSVLRQAMEEGGLDPQTLMSVSKNQLDVRKSDVATDKQLTDLSAAREVETLKHQKSVKEAATVLEQVMLETRSLEEALDGE